MHGPGRGGAAQTASAINESATGAASLSLVLDVSIADQVEGALKRTADGYGRLDIIFNNVGIGGMRDWDTTVAVNLSECFHAVELPTSQRLGKWQWH